MKRVPILSDGHAVTVTKQEKDCLDTYLSSGGDINDASKHSGLSLDKANEFIKSPRIAVFVAQRIEEFARKNDLTLEKVLSKLHRIAFEKESANRAEMKALEMLSTWLGVLKPAGINIGVAVHTNPLEKVPDLELDQMIRSRIGNASEPQG